MKKKRVIILIVIALCIVGFVKCGSGNKTKDEVTAEEAAEILEGKVKVPDTYFKTQEEVELMFENAGLVPQFVVRNFDDAATINERYLREGECDQIDEDSGATYYSRDEVGDLYGYYADEGATIIVGYSDHDFDGTAGVTPDAEETPSAEETAEESTEPAETTSNESADSSAISDDITARVEELNAKYDNVIEQVKGFANDPSTYTLTAYTAFMADYTDIITDLGELSEIINESDAVSNWEGYDIWMSILVKNTELTTAISEMPSDFAS